MRTPSTLHQLQKHLVELKNENSELSKALEVIYSYFKSISAYKFYQKDNLNLNLMLALMQGLLPVGITRSISKHFIDQYRRRGGNISNLRMDNVTNLLGLAVNGGLRVYRYRLQQLGTYAMVLGMSADVSSHYTPIIIGNTARGPVSDDLITPPFVPPSEYYYSRDRHANLRYLFNSIMLEASKPFTLMSVLINYDKIIELTKIALALNKAPALHEAGQYPGKDLAQPLQILARQAANTIELQTHRGLTMYGSMNQRSNSVSVVALPVTYYVWFGRQNSVREREVQAVHSFLNCEVEFIDRGTTPKYYTSQVMAYVVLLESIKDFLNEYDIIVNTLHERGILQEVKTQFTDATGNLTDHSLEPLLATNLSENTKTRIIECFRRVCAENRVNSNVIMQQLRSSYIAIFNKKRARPPVYGLITFTLYMLGFEGYHNFVASIARFINYVYLQLCYLIYHSIITMFCYPRFLVTNYRLVFGDFVRGVMYDFDATNHPKWIIGSASSMYKYGNPIGLIYANHTAHLNEIYTMRVIDEAGVRAYNGQEWPNSSMTQQQQAATAGRVLDAAQSAYNRQHLLFTIDYPHDASNVQSLKLMKMYVDTIVNQYYHAAFAGHMVHSMLSVGQNVQSSYIHLIYDAVIHDTQGLREIGELLGLISNILHWQIVKPFLSYLDHLITSNTIPYRAGYIMYYAVYGGYLCRSSTFETIFTVARNLFPQYNPVIGPILLYLYSFTYFFVIYNKYREISNNLTRLTRTATTESIVYTKQNLNAAIRQYNSRSGFNQFLFKCFNLIKLAKPLNIVINVGLNTKTLANVVVNYGTVAGFVTTAAVFTGSTAISVFIMSKTVFKIVSLILIGIFGLRLVNRILNYLIKNVTKENTRANKIATSLFNNVFDSILDFIQRLSSIILYPISGYVNTDVIKLIFRRFNPFTIYLEILKFFVQTIGDIIIPLYQASTGSLSLLIIKPITLVKDRLILDFKNSPLMIIYWYFTSTPYLMNKMTVTRFFFSIRRYSLWNLVYKLIKIPFSLLQGVYFNIIDANGIQQRTLIDKANTPIKLQDNTIRQIYSNRSNFVLIDSPKRKTIAIIKPDNAKLIKTYESYVTKYDGLSVDVIIDFAILLQYPRYFLYELYQKKKTKTNSQVSKKDAAQFARSVIIETVKRPRFLNKQLIFVLYLIDEYLTIIFDAAKKQNEQLFNVKDELEFTAKQLKKNQARRYTLITQRSKTQQFVNDMITSTREPVDRFYYQNKYISNLCLILGHILKQYPHVHLSEYIIQNTIESDQYNKIYVVEAMDIKDTCFIGVPLAKVAVVLVPHRRGVYRPLHYYALEKIDIKVKLGAFPLNSVLADSYIFVDTKQWKMFIENKQDVDKNITSARAKLQALKAVYQMKQQISFAVFKQILCKRLQHMIELIMDMRQLLQSFEPTYQLFYLICKNKEVSKVQQALNNLETHLTKLKQDTYTDLNQLVNSNMQINNFLDYAKFSQKLELIVQKLYYNYVKYDVEYCKFNEKQLRAPLYDLISRYASEYGLSTIYKYIAWYFIIDKSYTPLIINMLANRLNISEDWTYARLDTLHDQLFYFIEGIFRHRVGFIFVENAMDLAQQNAGTHISGFQEFIDPTVFQSEFTERINRIMTTYQAMLA